MAAMEVAVLDVIKILVPAAAAFFIGIAITPPLAHVLYTYKAWKKKAGKGAGYGGGATPLFDELHKERDTGTPRMGGVVIWGSVLLTTLGVWLLNLLFDGAVLGKLDFLSRSQTWLPLGALLIGALVGLMDDLLIVTGKGRHYAGGLPLWQRLAVVAAVALISGAWFFVKLDVSEVAIAFYGALDLGLLFVPFFVLVALAIYASGVIDGIDGLSGGVFGAIFASYALIAFFQNQLDLAAFCATLVGAILAFLWFNIPPARFYMTETGIMGLTMALTLVAFMTDTLGDGVGVFVLPLIAFPLVATVASDIIQVASKKYFGRKVFRVAPLHHHFEALGWPGYKVVMRYWVLSAIFATLGVIVALVG